jgi:hypothetical protein
MLPERFYQASLAIAPQRGAEGAEESRRSLRELCVSAVRNKENLCTSIN